MQLPNAKQARQAKFARPRHPRHFHHNFGIYAESRRLQTLSSKWCCARQALLTRGFASKLPFQVSMLVQAMRMASRRVVCEGHGSASVQTPSDLMTTLLFGGRTCLCAQFQSTLADRPQVKKRTLLSALCKAKGHASAIKASRRPILVSASRGQI